ncbi:MAG: hypothetical protein CEO19_458 [Parcubacteria group bacterium Gr01-1014_73]|nr:MAG: hypothetical protein CEO19_458 [Parcubacteria group bacterium Gr01-1014_73]
MKLIKSMLDTPEAKASRASVNISACSDKITDDNGPIFVRECYENLGRKMTTLTKEAIILGINTDPESWKELNFCRDTWMIWFRVLGKCVEDIDNDQAFNPVQVLTAIAWLESELFGFEETLKDTKRSMESG